MKVVYSKIKKIINDLFSKPSNTGDVDNHISYLRNHNLLTELPNREKLIDTFNASIEQSVEKEKAIFCINIDRLHSINERYGRAVGDKVIIKISKQLQSLFKNENSVFREEHFYLYLDDVSSNDLERIGNQIRNLTEKPLEIEGRTFYVTVSIGISHYPSTAENVNSLLQQAEIAMSKAKDYGKNNFEIILQEDVKQMERKRKIEFNLKEVLSREELYLVYQPEVCMKTGKISGVEALLRWDSPELGNISPVEFIPIAEETGVMIRIGEWVIREAVSQAKKWHDKGIEISLAVNVSYVQFKDKSLVQYIIKTLESFDFDPRYLIVEITESMMRDHDLVDLVAKDLTEHHIRIAIDDFGTGYSSLSALGNMYIDMIKIDRAFVKDLPMDEKLGQIVKTMLQFSKIFGYTVIAEGIETPEQLAFLIENNGKYAQGYYFSKPVSPDEIIKYAEKNKIISE